MLHHLHTVNIPKGSEKLSLTQSSGVVSPGVVLDSREFVRIEVELNLRKSQRIPLSQGRLTSFSETMAISDAKSPPLPIKGHLIPSVPAASIFTGKDSASRCISSCIDPSYNPM
jgi:hypothetical protein